LFRLRRAELFGLHRDIAAALASMPDSDPERPVTLTSMRNIRRVLSGRTSPLGEQGDARSSRSDI
jgi:hypothetical protein